jgi:hypothetical protein
MDQPPKTLPLDYARRNLSHAVSVALRREGHLLLQGERLVIRAWQTLPADAAGLYARLWGRTGTVFVMDKIKYADVPDVGTACALLVQSGLAQDRSTVPTHVLLSLKTVVQLRRICRASGLPTKGVRQVLLDRLGPRVKRTDLYGDVVEIRHKALFRRLSRWFLMNHEGDLSRLVISDLGHVVYPKYTPSQGGALFRNRCSLLTYEALIEQLFGERLETDWAAIAPEALSILNGAAVEPVGRQRFSPRYLSEKLCRRSIRAVERVRGSHEAIPFYEKLLAAKPTDPDPIVHRLALCLERSDRSQDAIAACRAAIRCRPNRPYTLYLARTGKRLATRVGEPWEEPAPLQRAPTRQLFLEQTQDSPPMFATPTGDAAVEYAVIAWLAERGRFAVHSENALWTSLFGLLFHRVLFADIVGMLPGPHLYAPLDLGRPGFAERRQSFIEKELAAIASDSGWSRLRERWHRYHKQAIVGVNWSLDLERVLIPVCEALGTQVISEILQHLALDYRTARSGQPDLCILPGSIVTHGESMPISDKLVLAEVKGPTDSLRDNQRWSHDKLLQLGLLVEVWNVSPSQETNK